MSDRHTHIPAVQDVHPIRIENIISAYRAGDTDSAHTWFQTFSERGLEKEESSTVVYLRRCASLVLPPEAALGEVWRAGLLAEKERIEVEVAFCLAAFGCLQYEVRDLQGARESLLGSLSCGLAGVARGIALNNLALVEAEADLEKARDLLAEALQLVSMREGSAVISNMTVLDGVLTGRPPQVTEALCRMAEAGADQPVIDSIRFNYAQSLLTLQKPTQAYRALLAFMKPSAGADDLPKGRWARLEVQICRALHRVVPPDIKVLAANLASSTRPSAWFYQKPWALCPLPLYLPAEP